MLWLSKSPVLALLFLIFHSHVISSSSSSSYVPAQCRPDETRAALLNLNCSVSANCWPSFECDATTGHVTSFSLYILNGTITSKSSLFTLHHLQSLDITGDDDLKTKISSDAFDALTQNLTRLQYIFMSGINMSSVPPASLMNLSSSLKSLRIIYCQLTGKLPHSFLHFPNLDFLDLRGNNLGGQLPSPSSNFSKLTILSLYSNSFSGPIPPWIYALPNLEWLFLEDNLFTGEIGEFQTSSLSQLALSNNALQGAIPRSLFQNMELEDLDLSSNNFTGIVDLQELSKLKNLYYLDLSHNNISLTSNCTNCTLWQLQTLQLSSCNLTEFPQFLRSSKQLGVLNLSNSQIHGIVPNWLHELRLLSILDLHSNFFFGPLPIISPRLIFFSASKNRVSGEIPSSICNITSLRVLDLSYNNLSGRIPRFTGNVESLSVLDLRSNKLHGEIPESLFVSESWLKNLNLNGNQLEGQVPRSLVNCSRLEALDLGNNEFNDTFPDWIESLPKLQVLVLRGNMLHGSVGNPNTGFPFPKLRIMDLSHNDFTGALPAKYFDNFQAMKMDTRNLKLSYMGEKRNYYYYQYSITVTMKGIDFELVKIQTIFTTIDFSSNYFTGEIPELLGKLKSLNGLNLSHNALTGILPPSLGNLINLEWLDFSSNELVGNIPVELAYIPWLSYLNVSYNYLEGPIPHGSQFNTFRSESFEGNLNLCGFPLSKLCGTKPPEPSLEQDDDDESSNITNGFNWRIVMMGYASGLVIGISIGYMFLYSNGKLHWLSERILEEIEYRRAIKPKKRNARRPLRR